MKQFISKYWWCFPLLYLVLTLVCSYPTMERITIVIVWILTLAALVFSQVILFISKDMPKCVKSFVISVLGTLIIVNIPVF